MSVSARVDIKRNDFPRLPGKAKQGARRRLEEGGARAKARAQQLAPFDTGELRDNIDFYLPGSNLEVVLESRAPHGSDQEFGTRYQPGTPHIRPAIAEEGPKLEASFRDLGNDLR